MTTSILHRSLTILLMLCVCRVALAENSVTIKYDRDDPMQVFGVNHLREALQATGSTVKEKGGQVTIALSRYEPGLGPQAYRIQKVGDRGIQLISGDSVGAMYGAIDLAEQIQMGGGLEAIRDSAHKPYILRRGLKFNIPFDARAPSYDDTGTSAHKSIPVVWEWDFWRDFIAHMIRNRYNVLTLWTTNPYAGIVRLPDYPDANYDNVTVLKEPVASSNDDLRHFDHIDLSDPANTIVVKKISLDDKIAFWTRVFDYAKAHGIEIYVFHWNIYTFGAKGKYGIDDDGRNPKTIAYLRYCIRRFLETYPQIDGLGVAAGEHINLPLGEKEAWLWQTYGQGIMDYHKKNPARPITLILRQLLASLPNITESFKGYTAGPLHTDHKYARARVHSSTTSPYLDIEYRRELEQEKVPCWLNLRNDDLFILRWGDPDYVREFMANLPRDVMRGEAGYFLGPDGYVEAREIVQKDPALAGQLEVDKHWYRFMLFGRLGYEPTLPRKYFEGRIKLRFPEANATLLYDTWQASSRIVPLLNRSLFTTADRMISPEGCMSENGFLTVDDSFFKYEPMKGSGILSVQEYAKAALAGAASTEITPMDVATSLEAAARQTLAGVKKLRAPAKPGGKELQSTLLDLEAMAWLGRYYAAKIRGAAELAVYRADRSRTDAHERAVAQFARAVEDWTAYATAATKQYKPQRFSRTDVMDWWKILNDVKKELATVRNEK